MSSDTPQGGLAGWPGPAAVPRRRLTLSGRNRSEIRTVIATTNAIESLNARFRRSVKAGGHFPNEQAALKHLYLTIVSLQPLAVAAGAGPTAGRPPRMPSTSPSTGASAPAGNGPIPPVTPFA